MFLLLLLLQVLKSTLTLQSLKMLDPNYMHMSIKMERQWKMPLEHLILIIRNYGISTMDILLMGLGKIIEYQRPGTMIETYTVKGKQKVSHL